MEFSGEGLRDCCQQILVLRLEKTWLLYTWTYFNFTFYTHNAPCVYPHCKVSIGQYTKMCTSPLIFFQLQYFRWQIFEENIWSLSLSLYIWVRNDSTEIDHKEIVFGEQCNILQFGDELNVESNSWSQIFWMAHVTLFKYLIISNHYFTKKGFTDKDRVLVIICGNNLIHMWIFFNLIKPALQFPPPKCHIWSRNYDFFDARSKLLYFCIT